MRHVSVWFVRCRLLCGTGSIARCPRVHCVFECVCVWCVCIARVFGRTQSILYAIFGHRVIVAHRWLLLICLRFRRKIGRRARLNKHTHTHTPNWILPCAHRTHRECICHRAHGQLSFERMRARCTRVLLLWWYIHKKVPRTNTMRAPYAITTAPCTCPVWVCGSHARRRTLHWAIVPARLCRQSRTRA